LGRRTQEVQTFGAGAGILTRCASSTPFGLDLASDTSGSRAEEQRLSTKSLMSRRDAIIVGLKSNMRHLGRSLLKMLPRIWVKVPLQRLLL
jgi:hypothetical protein